jgi:hypothetical protein
VEYAEGFPRRNALINGCFRINQALPATSADDTYAHDQWNVLTQTGTIAVSTLTDVENELPYMARLTQSQAVAQRMGYAQMIEGKDCKHLRASRSRSASAASGCRSATTCALRSSNGRAPRTRSPRTW